MSETLTAQLGRLNCNTRGIMETCTVSETLTVQGDIASQRGLMETVGI